MTVATRIFRLLFALQDLLHRPAQTAYRPNPAALGVALGPDDGYVLTGDSIRLFYRAWSPHQPREVLACFHGLGAHGGHFRVIGEHLVSLGSQVYVVDLRGHGLSDGPRADLADMGRIIQDLDEVAVHLAESHPDLPLYFLGESLGASLVLRYAAEWPERLAGIILSGIELRPTVKPKIREALRYLPYLLFDTRANVIEMGDRERLVSRDPEHFPRAQHDPLRSEAFSARTIVEVHALIQEWPRLARKLDLPTLILQGGGDLLTDPQAAYELLEGIACPDKELAFFPGAYHGLFYDPDTPQVLEALARWLAARRTSSPSR